MAETAVMTTPAPARVFTATASTQDALPHVQQRELDSQPRTNDDTVNDDDNDIFLPAPTTLSITISNTSRIATIVSRILAHLAPSPSSHHDSAVIDDEEEEPPATTAATATPSSHHGKVAIQVEARAVSKAISIVEIVKRRLTEGHVPWFQYNRIERVVDVSSANDSSATAAAVTTTMLRILLSLKHMPRLTTLKQRWT